MKGRSRTIPLHETSFALWLGLGAVTIAGWSCARAASRPSEDTAVTTDEEIDDVVECAPGATDEGCPCEELTWTPCYDGAAETLGVGNCRQGFRACEGGFRGACVGQVAPQIEVCGNIADEDCDGAAQPCEDVTPEEECENEAPPCAEEDFALAEPFDEDYACGDLGSVEGVPFNYGGLTILKDDPDVLLIGGNANTAAGALYAVNLVRGCQDHIIGFDGPAERWAEAAYNDGGVIWGPDDVLLLARWPVNQLGQIGPGGDATEKIIDLYPLNVAYAHAALAIVPDDWAGAGMLKMLAWPAGQMYDAELVEDGEGLFDLQNLQPTGISLGGGPEGFIHVPRGSPQFDEDSLLVSEFTAGNVSTYELDDDGNPRVESRRDFMPSLQGAEGAAIDPLSGDFLFCTFGRREGLVREDIVVVVRGFAAPPPPDPLD